MTGMCMDFNAQGKTSYTGVSAFARCNAWLMLVASGADK